MRGTILTVLLAGVLCAGAGFGAAAEEPLVGIGKAADGTAIAEANEEIAAKGETAEGLDQEEKGMAETINARVSRMSREEKVGQMLLVSPAQLCDGEDWTANPDMVIQNMKNYYVGGLVFFSEDLDHPEAVRDLIRRTRELEGIPVLTVAAAGGSLATGFVKPEESTAVLLGPLSIGTDGIWCYSTVQEPGETERGLGILLDAKPGVSSDLDMDFAIVTHARVQYDPAVSGLEGRAADDGRPASMARSLVTGELRETFDGVIMTDSLCMPEATQSYGGDMAVMNALQAGADLLTAPANVMTAYYGIHSAIDEQMVAEAQIDASVARILEAKAKLGLNF